MTDDFSRAATARRRQERWEHHMYGFCLLDNHLNVEMEAASHRSTVLSHVVAQTNRVKDLWYAFQRETDNGCVLEDTAVQMAIDQHGLQSVNFHQPQMQNIRVSFYLFYLFFVKFMLAFLLHRLGPNL